MYGYIEYFARHHMVSLHTCSWGGVSCQWTQCPHIITVWCAISAVTVVGTPWSFLCPTYHGVASVRMACIQSKQCGHNIFNLCAIIDHTQIFSIHSLECLANLLGVDSFISPRKPQRWVVTAAIATHTTTLLDTPSESLLSLFAIFLQPQSAPAVRQCGNAFPKGADDCDNRIELFQHGRSRDDKNSRLSPLSLFMKR